MMNRKQPTFAELRREAIKLLVTMTAKDAARIINDRYQTHFMPQKLLDIAEGRA